MNNKKTTEINHQSLSMGYEIGGRTEGVQLFISTLHNFVTFAIVLYWTGL